VSAEPAVLDGRVHHRVLVSFVERGHPPDIEELARGLGLADAEVAASLARLHAGHGLVLHPGTSAIWLAHPFSASPAAVWVALRERGWWAPCLWCGLGVATLAAPEATLHARLGGEHESVRIALARGEPRVDGLQVHFPTPPRDAWNNVLHWCASVQPFRRAAEVDAWCARHRLPRGELVPLERVAHLARVWYGRHLDPHWRKWTIAEAQAIFAEVGLVGEFWRLPVADRPF
jgi:hypothetical protein